MNYFNYIVIQSEENTDSTYSVMFGFWFVDFALPL